MKTQNWLLLGIGAFALYKIVKASRSNKDASNDGEFKNAVSNQNLVSSKKVNCDCDRILRWDVQMIGGRPYYVGKWTGKGSITQTQTPNGGFHFSCQSNPKCGNDEKYVAINPPQPVIFPI